MDGVAALMNLRAWAIMPVGIHRGCSATQDTTSLCCLLTNIPMQARQHALWGRGGGAYRHPTGKVGSDGDWERRRPMDQVLPRNSGHATSGGIAVGCPCMWSG